MEKVEKLVADLHNKEEYIIRIRNLKQVSNLGLVLKKMHRIIKFSQKAWLKPYIDMNTDQKKKLVSKNGFERNLFKLVNNAVFGKKHRDVKLVKTEARKNYLVKTKQSYKKNLLLKIH